MKRILCLWLVPEASKRSDDLALACERYSPCVGRHGDDCLLLDITSIGALFGGEERLQAALLADVTAQGFQARAAIANTVGAAWAQAHFDAPLPIAALRLPAEQLVTLHELGLELVEQLVALPRSALAERFGNGLLRQLDRALGLEDELIVPVRPAPEFRAEWLLEHPTSDRAALVHILEQLTQRVAEGLRLRDQGAVQLACRLDVADQPPRLVQIGLFRPSAQAEHFMELLRLQSELLRLRGAVGRVGLSAVTTARLEHRQKELFATAMANHSDELARLINRLSSRLGRERVVRPQLTTDAVPERAWREELLTALPRVVEKRAKSAKRKERIPPVYSRGANEAPGALWRPLLLHEPPVALDVIALAPEGSPASFTYQQQAQRVAWRAGPERIETAWWRGASVRRDYYRVETETGQRYWLFRNLRDGRWFLHGSFA